MDGLTSTPNIPGRGGAAAVNTSGCMLACPSRTSTRAFDTGLNVSSRVRCIANRLVSPATSGGYSTKSSDLVVQLVMLSGGGSGSPDFTAVALFLFLLHVAVVTAKRSTAQDLR